MSTETVHGVSCRFQVSFFAMCRLHTFPWKVKMLTDFLRLNFTSYVSKLIWIDLNI